MKKYRVLKKILKFPSKIVIAIIRFYQKFVSRYFGKRCIYYPTCSEYTRQAVDKYGIIKGSILGLKRILRCNPFSNGGVDYLK